MSADRDDRALSKLMSLALRHEPDALGLTLDAHGWVGVDELLLGLARRGRAAARADVERVVATSDKQRFALSPDGARIRANQGHSVEVDLGYAPAAPPARLFHGTAAVNLPSIRAGGLVRGARHHVHLSETVETARTVGARHGKPVVLAVDAAGMHGAGLVFFRSANGVWLTEHVPAVYLAEL